MLDGPACEDAVDTAVRAAEAAGPRPDAANDLAALLALVPGERSAEILSLALESARAIDSDREQVEALASLLPSLHGEVKADVARQAIASAEQLPDPVERIGAFVAIAQGSDFPELRDRALEVLRAIENQVSRARAILHLSAMGLNIWPGAVRAIELLADDWAKAQAVVQLADLGVAVADLLRIARAGGRGGPRRCPDRPGPSPHRDRSPGGPGGGPDDRGLADLLDARRGAGRGPG
jgi:hypothetical protein